MPISKVEEVAEFPPLVRGNASRNKEEKDLFVKLISNGKKNKISGIEDKQEYTAMQQRIRNVAKAMGLTVKIQYKPEENALYLQETQAWNKEKEAASNASPTPESNGSETKTAPKAAAKTTK